MAENYHSTATIDDLDNDSLRQIFTELSLRDRLRLERVSRRWRDVSQQAWSNCRHLQLSAEYKHSPLIFKMGSDKFELRKGSFNDRVLERLLIRCGRFLKALSLLTCNIDYTRDTLPIIAKYCKNIKKLEFQFGKCPLESKLGKLFTRCQNLEYLNLKQLDEDFNGDCLKKLPKETITEIHLWRKEYPNYGVYASDRSLSYAAAEAIRDCCNLHTLELIDFSLKADHLKPITENQTLTHASFPFCIFFTSELELVMSITLIGNLRNLEYLNMLGVDEIHDAFFNCLATNCTQLKSLDIRHSINVSDDGIAEISRLPHIEILLINDQKTINGNSFGRMATLKELECANCPNIQDRRIIPLIETAPNLKYLCLINTSVTAATLEAATRVTRRRTNGVMLKISVDHSIKKHYNDYGKPSPLLTIDYT